MLTQVWSVKKVLVKSGVVTTVLLFWILAIKIFFYGDGLLSAIVSFVFASIPILVIIGLDIGYSLSKLLIGLLAVINIGGGLGPFTYGDFLLGKDPSYMNSLIFTVIIEFLLLVVFYCLGEHQLERKGNINV